MSPPDDPFVEETCPDLWSLLTLEKYAAGQERTPADILIERVPGGYQITVKDHDSGDAWVIPLDRLENLAVSVERGLSEERTVRKTFKSFKNKKGLDKFRPKKA